MRTLLVGLGLFASSAFSWSWNGPYYVQNLNFDMTDPTAECIDIRVKVGTVDRVYRYNYMEPGNNFEKAKMLFSLALMAHSNKRRVSFYGENYPNQTTVWKLRGLSVLD